MAGRIQWEAQVDSNVAKLLSETKELRDQLDGIKKGNYEIKLNIDDKKLEKVISNLDKMLESLGKGTGDFKEFENLSKQLNEIVSEVKELNKAFGGINDSGVSNLLSSIQSIDKSLSSLSEHITNVNKDFGSVGKNASDNVGQINEARKDTEGLTEATKELANAQKNVGNKSNILSPMKDTFQGDIKASEMGKVATAVDEAVQAKKDFATANEGVQASVDGSKSKLELETELMERLAKSAREAADAKKEFVEANKQVQGSIDDTGKSVKKDKYKNKSKISEDEYTGKSDYYASIANQKLKNSGNTILGETVSTELVDGLVKVNAKIKTTDDTWKTFSAKIDADGNMFEQRFRTITKGVDKLETELKNFGLDTNPALTYGETLKKAEEIRSSLKLDDSYTIKVDSNELVTITQKLSDVESSTTSVTQTFKSAQDAIEHFGKEASSSAEKTTVALKGVKASAESIGEAVDESDSHLDKIGTKLDKYRKDFNNFSAVPDADHRFASFEIQLSDLDIAITKLETHQNALRDKGFVDEADISETKRLSTEIDNLIEKIKKVPQSKRGYKDVAVSKMAEKIASILEQHPRLAKKAKAEIQGYYNELASGNPTRPLDEILDRVNKIIQGQREAGRTGKGFIDILSDKALYGQAAQLAGYYLSLTDFIRYGKQAVDTIIELDTALIDLKKTTAMSGSEMENFYFEANDVAKEMGVTTQAIIEQSSAWSRLGYNTKEASTEMAKLSSKFATISPGMDTDTAQEGLVSIMKAWDIDVDQVESEVIDKINTLGNNFAEENQDIVEGMKRSAAALASTGTTYQDAFALFTGAQEVLQNSEVTGRALRSISMRIHGYSENSEDGLAELDEELTNITGDLIDLTKTAEHTQGVSIFKDGSTTEFKSLVDYFGEINAIWDEMSQKQQNDFLQMAFGKTQAQAGAALIQNYESVVGALEKMEQSAGSADAEMAAVESSLNYKINSLKETWVGTVQEMIDRGDLGVIIDGLVKLSEAIGFVLDKAGLLGTAGVGIGAYLGIKNVGTTNYISCRQNCVLF